MSLGELQTRILVNPHLPYARRREIASAINSTGKWFSLPLEMIPASARFLRDRFKHVHPLHKNISARRIENVRSLLMAGFRAEGLNTKLAPYMSVMTPEWTELWSSLETNSYHRAELSRFFRYCSAQKIRPANVNDQISSRYLTALETEALIKNPRTRHQSVCRVWNACVKQHRNAGWPQVKLTVPRYEDRLYSIDPDLVAPAIKRDLENYLACLRGDDPFSRHSRPFRQRSLEVVKGNFWRYLSALHFQGIDLITPRSLSELVTTEKFTLAMRWFWERNERKTSKYIGEIAWVIRCYAVKHLEADEKTEAFYKEALGKLRVNEPGLSPKNQRAMSQFDDPKTVERFLSLPPTLWEALSSSEKLGSSDRIRRKKRLLVQSAVAIEILIFAPMRLKNLQEIRLDEHIAWQNGRLHIHIPSDQVKNNLALDFLLPESISKRVKRYIDTWRPFLASDHNPYLFPGRAGKPKDSTCLRRQIETTLWNEAGIRLTPHQFRHAAAKILLDAKPGHYEVVRKILGHKTLTTTYSHYAGAETQAALNLYDQVIIEKRRGKTLRPGTRPETNSPPFLDPLQLFGGTR